MRRVMLVDDQEEFLQWITSQLTLTADFRVNAVATNGNDALNMMENTDIEVAIIDVVMPGMNGFDTARQMILRNPKLPIVIMSSSDEEAYRDLCRSLGFSFIPKAALSVASLQRLLQNGA